MNSFKTLNNLLGWLVFGIAMVVYCMSAESSGSLWDCGEFVAGADKLQVVHPPGAPLFLLIGRLAIMIGHLFSNDPSTTAFSVNILSGICSALIGTFVCWSTIILGKLALVGREDEPNRGQFISLGAAGLVAGLCSTFATSIWFSAVEGEVYAMSTFFTAMTFWGMLKWYNLPDSPQADRWILFAVYSAGLSIGVHLLSLLTFPALALFYYFKKYKEHSWLGMIGAAVTGVAFIVGLQALVITGIPKLWGMLEILMVNTFGLPFNLSLIPLLGIIGTALWYGFKYAKTNMNGAAQNIMMGLALSIISFSTIGVVLLRAQANPPINMNNPSDPIRLIPYLNREQYGERPLLFGPQFNARPLRSETADRYGRVGDKYEITDRKIDYVFNNGDKVFFPRMGHYEGEKAQQYKAWMGLNSDANVPDNRPNFIDNYSFFFQYQIGWMYWRYFMWNFSGRQNSNQGYEPWDKSAGHWISGITPLDNARLFDQSQLTQRMKDDPSRNRYYMIPFLLGVLGMFFHYRRRRNDFIGLLAMFVITGVGIIVYSNQPPIEPRERDYVLAGSIFTYCIWIGLGVIAIAEMLRKRVGAVSGPIAGLVGLSAPFLMLTQNFDDHSRHGHYASRDYASNFLNSVDSNAIVFTYGDNDTYPLWYAQEVEGIRTDVRVVNLSLIAVDWYIDQLRRKVNNSPAIKMTIPEAQMRGFKRNQIPLNSDTTAAPMSILAALKYIGEDHPYPIGQGVELESSLGTPNLYIDIDKAKIIANHVVPANMDSAIVSRMNFRLDGSSLIKDDIAVLDIIGSNIQDRPVYFAVTSRPDKLLGMTDYMQLEGLAMRVVPVKSVSETARYSIVGSGYVSADKLFKNITERFKWGNFDKQKVYVNPSYQPSIQSTRLVVMRAANDMVLHGDTKRAVELVDKYFEAFPDMNFPYDIQALQMIQVYVDAKANDKAKKHMSILLRDVEDQLRMFTALGPDVVQTSFLRDYALALRCKDIMLTNADRMGDAAFKAELEKRIGQYKPMPQLN